MVSSPRALGFDGSASIVSTGEPHTEKPTATRERSSVEGAMSAATINAVGSTRKAATQSRTRGSSFNKILYRLILARGLPLGLSEVLGVLVRRGDFRSFACTAPSASTSSRTSPPSPSWTRPTRGVPRRSAHRGPEWCRADETDSGVSAPSGEGDIPPVAEERAKSGSTYITLDSVLWSPPTWWTCTVTLPRSSSTPSWKTTSAEQPRLLAAGRRLCRQHSQHAAAMTGRRRRAGRAPSSTRSLVRQLDLRLSRLRVGVHQSANLGPAEGQQSQSNACRRRRSTACRSRSRDR